MGKSIKQTVLKRSTNGQLLHEEVKFIIHKGNGSQSNIKILSHISQNGNKKQNYHKPTIPLLQIYLKECKST
jgi:hypothetical protein